MGCTQAKGNISKVNSKTLCYNSQQSWSLNDIRGFRATEAEVQGKFRAELRKMTKRHDVDTAAAEGELFVGSPMQVQSSLHPNYTTLSQSYASFMNELLRKLEPSRPNSIHPNSSSVASVTE
eukprot:4826570-Amphidinium_carterae.1